MQPSSSFLEKSEKSCIVACFVDFLWVAFVMLMPFKDKSEAAGWKNPLIVCRLETWPTLKSFVQM